MLVPNSCKKKMWSYCLLFLCSFFLFRWPVAMPMFATARCPVCSRTDIFLKDQPHKYGIHYSHVQTGRPTLCIVHRTTTEWNLQKRNKLFGRWSCPCPRTSHGEFPFRVVTSDRETSPASWCTSTCPQQFIVGEKEGENILKLTMMRMRVNGNASP